MSENLINIGTFDAYPLFREIVRHDEWINKDSYRAMLTDVADVMLRGPDLTDSDHTDIARLHNEIECQDYTTSDIFSKCRALADEILEMTKGETIGRIIITVLEAGKKIEPHVDEGEAGEYYDRYHAVIQGGPGNVFKSGDEGKNLYTGEIWYVNNHITHSVKNNMKWRRIHMIVDIGGSDEVNN